MFLSSGAFILKRKGITLAMLKEKIKKIVKHDNLPPPNQQDIS